MKKKLLKLSSALLVVAVASSCAFAQGQSSTTEVKSLKSAAVKTEAKTVKVESADRDIYRAVDTSAKTASKSGEAKANPIVTKRSATVAQPSSAASRVEQKAQREATVKTATMGATLKGAKSQPVQAEKKRVNNTVKALPADYKARETRTSKSQD